MINVLDKWEVGGASCSACSTRPWPSARIRPRLKLDIPLFAKRINHYSSMISQFSSDTAESSVCNGQLCQGGEYARPRKFREATLARADGLVRLSHRLVGS